MKNSVKTYILLATMGGLIILIGGLVGRGLGATVGLLAALAFTGGSYWFSDRIAIKASRAAPVTEAQMPEYYAVVRDLTRRAGLPMPKLYVSPSPQPNAFATGRNPRHAAVAVTQGILTTLSWEELRGVLAHEISHVGNRDILIGSVAAASAMGIMWIARIGLFFGGGGRRNNALVSLGLFILAPVAAMLLQMALTRSREFEADRSGARLVGDGEPLASALAKIEAGVRSVPMNIQPAAAQAFIVNPLTGRKMAFSGLFRTHPPTGERIERLRSGQWRS
jgi:heat shock protein HtpX